ncbi:DUF4255 domain-containing protein [Streptomyces sp. NPDC006197]|uniref:DUF4255 domain-containing protein n=1 Tax=Streptomyces sp. NPDC006197 TaxID=3156685 RepID=UPI0033B92AF3
MSTSTAIGMVSASLRNLLVGEMGLQPTVTVTILAPDEQGSDRRVNLFLYKIAENPFLKNADWALRPGSADRIVDAPLSLNLTYLLTPYAPNDEVNGNVAAHQVLGEAMRVFHENPVVPRKYLDPGLTDAREHLQISSCALEPEELRGLWTALAKPFRLSVPYQVSTVQLDRRPSSAQTPAPRVRRVEVPGVATAVKPPTITGMSPTIGSAGAVLTFTGTHLAGQRATVQCAGRTVTEDLVLSEDSFTVRLADDLNAGLHEVRVDVSRLFRRTFLFQVTP